jgi:hypothetical protein
MEWTAGVRSPTEAEDFSSNLCFQTSSVTHPASYTMGTGGKARPGRDADHSLPSSAEVKKEQELYLLSHKCASMERNRATSPFLYTVGSDHRLFLYQYVWVGTEECPIRKVCRQEKITNRVIPNKN